MGGPESQLGPNPSSFGHTGWGGAFTFADPDNGLGVVYVACELPESGDVEPFDLFGMNKKVGWFSRRHPPTFG